MSSSLKLLVVLGLVLSLQAATSVKSFIQLGKVRLVPISEEQYQAILVEVKDNENSYESKSGRSLGPDLKEITKPITARWNSFLKLAGFTTEEGRANAEDLVRSNYEGVPLCIIKTSNLVDKKSNLHYRSKRQYGYDYHYGGSYPSYSVHHGDYDSSESSHTYKGDSKRPVINCVVVVKRKKPEPKPSRHPMKHQHYEHHHQPHLYHQHQNYPHFHHYTYPSPYQHYHQYPGSPTVPAAPVAAPQTVSPQIATPQVVAQQVVSPQVVVQSPAVAPAPATAPVKPAGTRVVQPAAAVNNVYAAYRPTTVNSYPAYVTSTLPVTNKANGTPVPIPVAAPVAPVATTATVVPKTSVTYHAPTMPPAAMVYQSALPKLTKPITPAAAPFTPRPVAPMSTNDGINSPNMTSIPAALSRAETNGTSSTPATPIAVSAPSNPATPAVSTVPVPVPLFAPFAGQLQFPPQFALPSVTTVSNAAPALANSPAAAQPATVNFLTSFVPTGQVPSQPQLATLIQFPAANAAAVTPLNTPLPNSQQFLTQSPVRVPPRPVIQSQPTVSSNDFTEDTENSALDETPASPPSQPPLVVYVPWEEYFTPDGQINPKFQQVTQTIYARSNRQAEPLAAGLEKQLMENVNNDEKAPEIETMEVIKLEEGDEVKVTEEELYDEEEDEDVTDFNTSEEEVPENESESNEGGGQHSYEAYGLTIDALNQDSEELFNGEDNRLETQSSQETDSTENQTDPQSLNEEDYRKARPNEIRLERSFITIYEDESDDKSQKRNFETEAQPEAQVHNQDQGQGQSQPQSLVASMIMGRQFSSSQVFGSFYGIGGFPLTTGYPLLGFGGYNPYASFYGSNGFYPGFFAEEEDDGFDYGYDYTSEGNEYDGIYEPAEDSSELYEEGSYEEL